MGYIKFLNDETQYDVISISKSAYSENAVRIEFSNDKVENTNGFNYYKDGYPWPLGEYANNKFVFKNDEPNAVEYSTVDEKYTPPTKEVEVSAVWNDNEDEDKLRPTSIKANVKADGENLKTVTLNKKNAWKAVVDGIDADAEVIITTADVNGYETTINQTVISLYHKPNSQIKDGKINEIIFEAQDRYNAGVIYNGVTYSYDPNLLATYEIAVQTGKAVNYKDNKLTHGDLSVIYIKMEEQKIAEVNYSEQLVDMIRNMEDIEAIKAVTYGTELDSEHQTICDEKIADENETIEAYIAQHNYANAEEVTSVEEAIVELYEMFLM